MAVRVRLLGPVDIVADGIPVRLNGVRRKALLAGLALSAGWVVENRRLIDLVWRESPPPETANALQRHISFLRKALGSRDALVARSPGYLLNLGAEPTDVHIVERLLREAAATPDPRQRLDRLRSATTLWSGPPLNELRELPWFDEQARQLDDLLLRARLELLDVRLALGEGARVVTELESLARVHPWHEEIAGLLMRALYGIGRQADALSAFQRLRRALNEELGIDPGPRLHDLETAILRHDPSLSEPTSAPSPSLDVVEATPAWRVPAQLPLAVHGFTGRDADLAMLDGYAAQSGVVAIAGTAGVGKTALAVQWAHRVARDFPDGQLYVNLRGYDPDQPVPAADALAGFLRALGVAGAEIPLQLDERSGRYRTALAGRRVLVVLDNAGSAEQVRPLLPGASGCLVVVTSRDSLAGLVALDGARRLDLGLLAAADAITLLRRLIGARVDDEPDRAAELAEQCARLPLALRVAAELAVAEPETSLATLTKALTDQRGRLDLLDAGGEIRTAVSSVFSWSYQQLPADAASAFRAIGLHPGPDFDVAAIAALTAYPVEQAARLCAKLARAHLIEARGARRYSIHDLLRVYALDRAEASADERRAALTRLFDHYLAGAAAAMDTLHPAERSKRPHVEPLATTPPLPDPGPARAWLDAELPSLVAACAYASGHGWAGHAIRLAHTLFRHLDMGGHHAEALTVHNHARRAAWESGDRSAEARALNNLAAVHWWRAEYSQAGAHYREAVELFREAGDRVGEADALTNLGMLDRTTGDVASAAGHYERALVTYRAIGHPIGEAGALHGLGVVNRLAGRLDQAAEHLDEALALCRDAGKLDGEADTLTGLAALYQQQGQLSRAAEHLEMALAVYRKLNYPGNEARTLNSLGAVARETGDLTRAVNYHEQALELLRGHGTRNGEAATLNDLGGTLLVTGAGPEAARRHAEALAIAVADGDRYQQARAQDGLAAACRAMGDTAGAHRHWEQALQLFTALGTAESDAVRARLDELSRAG